VSISARLRLGVGVALALALLFFFFKDMDWPALGRALRTADPLFLAGVVLAAILTYTLRAWRWGYLLAPMARVPFLDLFSATTVGFMTGLVIPRAGEIVRPYLVAQRHGVTTSAGVAFVALAALVLLALLVVFHARADEALAFFDRLLRLFPQWLARWAGGVLRAFAGGLAVLKAPLPHLLAIVAQSFLVWLSIAASIWFNNRAFGIGLPFHATFLIIAFLTVGVAIPTPGMVGGFHGFFVLATADVFGVHREVAGAAAIACHALSNLPVLVLGLAFLGREGLSLGRVAEMTERKDAGTIPATEGSR
jgi:uncharacterized membrane protein YbhN (UPF0104 family)